MQNENNSELALDMKLCMRNWVIYSRIYIMMMMICTWYNIAVH